MTTQDATLAARIRKARKRRGLSQKELAAKVGASERQVMRWEHREAPQHPSEAHAKALSRALGIQVPAKPEAPGPAMLRLQELVDEVASLRAEFEAFAELVVDRLDALEAHESSDEANGHRR